MLRNREVLGGYKSRKLERVFHRLRSVFHRLSTGYPQVVFLSLSLVVAAILLSGCRNLVRDFPSSNTIIESGGIFASLLRAQDGLTTVCVSLQPHNLQP